MRNRRIGRTLCSALLLTALVVAVGVVIPAAASASSRGGSITVGGWTLTLVDPAAVGYNIGGGTVGGEALGQLFVAPATVNGAPLPDLATSYTFSKHNTEMTIDLRHGVKFQDGTPFNAAAVVWNFQRYAVAGTTQAADFNLVSSMTPVGKYTVVLRFSAPNLVMIDYLDTASIGEMGSPTAFNKLGATNYGIAPVGAGPFTIGGVVPGQQVVLTRWPGYWDAKQVDLETITYTNTGSDATTQYDDVESNSIDITTFSGSTTAPPILYQALNNPSLNHSIQPLVGAQVLPMNTTKPPFNNILAREAVAYCTDKLAIANDVDQGYAQPAFIPAGAGEEFATGVVDGKMIDNWKYGEHLEPFQYDPAKGKEIVQELGGLSFTLTAANDEGGGQPLGIALAQMWTSCGMNVTQAVIEHAALTPDLESGNYQIFISSQAGARYPGTYLTYQSNTSGLNIDGWDSPAGPEIMSLIAKTNSITNQTELANTWHKIWLLSNENVLDFVVSSEPTFVVFNKCLKNLALYSGSTEFTHAYLICTP